jgi:hypothetical protein
MKNDKERTKESLDNELAIFNEKVYDIFYKKIGEMLESNKTELSDVEQTNGSSLYSHSKEFLAKNKANVRNIDVESIPSSSKRIT